MNESRFETMSGPTDRVKDVLLEHISRDIKKVDFPLTYLIVFSIADDAWTSNNL